METSGPKPITSADFKSYLSNEKCNGSGDCPESSFPSSDFPKLNWASKFKTEPNPDEITFSKSFKDLMMEDKDEEGSGDVRITPTKPRRFSAQDEKSDSKSKRKVSYSLTSGQPQNRKSKEREIEKTPTKLNPWTNFQIENETSPSQQTVSITSENAVSLSKVIYDEEKAKERWKKETQKPLNLKQIEEKALKELAAHYEMVHGRDGEELITVERAVEDFNWQPLWKKADS